MSLSLKVPVSVLLANAEAQRKVIVTQHGAQLKAHEDAIGEARKDLLVKLRDKVKNIRTAKLSSSRQYIDGRYQERVTITVSVNCPAKPEAKPDTSRIDRDLRLLRVTSQDVITVRVDSDLARYL